MCKVKKYLYTNFTSLHIGKDHLNWKRLVCWRRFFNRTSAFSNGGGCGIYVTGGKAIKERKLIFSKNR